MRIYNGCPDDEAKRKITNDNRAFARLKRAGYTATYFPTEEAWMAFGADHKPVSGFHDSLPILAEVVLK